MEAHCIVSSSMCPLIFSPGMGVGLDNHGVVDLGRTLLYPDTLFIRWSKCPLVFAMTQA